MIQSDLFAAMTLESASQKYWRFGSSCSGGLKRHPIRTHNKKVIAISRLPSVMQLPLVLLLVLACCCAASAEVQPVRRLTRRNSPAYQDEEELTIAAEHHFHPANFANHDQIEAAPAVVAWQQQLRPQKRESEFVDPFESTFVDYLREASGGRDETGAGDSGDENRISRPGTTAAAAAAEATKLIDDNDDEQQRLNELHPQQSNRRSPSLIIEEDDEQQQQQRRPAAVSARESQSQIEGNNNNNDRDNAQADALAALNEIKLLFAWRALPTNKCSRSCGRGHRLNHLSCVDLKFNVRVENELCERAQMPRPSETSDEPCNGHDCEPAWAELEYNGRECELGASECTRKAVKRLECAMVSGAGETVRLDESRCGASATTTTTSSHTRAADEKATTTSNLDNNELSIDLNEQLDKERNSIVSNEVPMDVVADPPSGLAGSGDHHHGSSWHQPTNERPRSNEPFYGPGEWSECSGAPCGQLGRRTRKLTCRLFLSRSSKLVDLPEASCVANGARVLDREEPCYMDCGPSGAPAPASSSSASRQHEGPSYSFAMENNTTLSNTTTSHLSPDDRLIELEDETIYDLEVARHVWRHGGWTKCSAECLGGVHESIVECWDRVAESSVDARHCDPLGKPTALRRACNEVPCAPEWRLGPFSECSHPCGSAGVRSRTVACVQQVPPGYHQPQLANLIGSTRVHDNSMSPATTTTTTTTTMTSSTPARHEQHQLLLLIPNELCLERHQAAAPNSIEPCNRHDCRPEWQLGPWSAECSRKCGEGTRNRTAICVQEFASRDGPLAQEANASHAIVSPDLKEAILLAAPSWHPGKAIQVPFSECYREFHSVPQLSEPCLGHNCTTQIDDEDDLQQQQQQQQEEWYIDADPLQDFRLPGPTGGALKRKTITLKIGGRAQVLEGRNVKIKCKLVRRRTKAPLSDLVSRHAQSSWGAVEWRLGGVRVFAPNTSVAEKEPLDSPRLETPDDNSILSGGSQVDDVLSLTQAGDDKYSMMAADEPPESRKRHGPSGTRRDRAAKTTSGAASRARVLSVRSWPIDGGGGELQQTGASSSFQFVPHPSGRFSLVKENMLRIKRLRLDDSGTYTCSSGPLSESIELTVVSRRGRKMGAPDQLLNNYA